MIGQTRFARRTLVVFSYVLFVCLVIFRATTGSHFILSDLGFIFILFLLMVSHRRVAERIQRKRRPYWPNPDEHDVSVRNRASFIALNVIAWYALILCVAGVVPFPSPYRLSASVIADYALFPLLVMAFTLPSAIILWIEPDVAGEDAS